MSLRRAKNSYCTVDVQTSQIRTQRFKKFVDVDKLVETTVAVLVRKLLAASTSDFRRENFFRLATARGDTIAQPANCTAVAIQLPS
jgi:hypothetical protein